MKDNNQDDQYVLIYAFIFSTISSGLNSLAAVTLQDFVLLLCFKDLTDARATQVSKVLGIYDSQSYYYCFILQIPRIHKNEFKIVFYALAIVYGAICIGLTFVAANLGGVLQVLRNKKRFNALF